MNVLALFKNITCFVFDVDGVLTDGTVYLMPGGEQVRRMNIKDGYALQLAIKKGYEVLVISGAVSEEVIHRMNGLGVKDVHIGVKDKLAVMQQFLQKNNISTESVLVMGDDVPDVQIMRASGVAACPADAVADIRSFAQYISPFAGGMGCVRDVIEKVMKIRGDWSLDTEVRSQ